MELQQVKYFLATCETLNFTRAAESCNVTQPALTKALKLLEYELGGDLFDRQSRPMRLTDLGSHLMGKFRSLQDIKTDITAQARLFSSLDRSVHTLGIVSTIGNGPFLRFVESLQRSAPGIAISLCLIPQAALEMRLREGALEIALLVEICTNADRLSMTRLYDEEYVLALPTEHPLAKKEVILLDDLNHIDYVHRIHCELNDRVEGILESSNIDLKKRLTTDQDAIAIQMIQSGLGVSIMPKSLTAGIAVTRQISDLALTRTVTLAHLDDRELSPSAAVIKDLIVKKADSFYGK